MSDKRSVEQIRSEYSNLCAKAGHVQYSIYTLQKDLEMINGTLRDLNVEAGLAAQAEQPSVEGESK